MDERDTVSARGLWPVDYAHGLFIAATAVLVVVRRTVVPHAALSFGLNVAMLLALFAVVRASRGRSAAFGAHARLVYTIVVIPLIFTQLGGLVPYVNTRHYERELFDFDHALAGGRNPLLWLDRFANPWLTEILQWVYNYYFFIPVILGVAVVRAGRIRDLARMLFVTTFCIYLSYVGYYLVPATGPNIDKLGLYAFPRELEGVFMAHELRLSIAAVEKIKQDCFPSGHTAVSLVALLLAYRSARRSVPVLWPLVVALIFSTLYLRYHYVADVLAGILLAFFSDFVGLRIHRAFERRTDSGGHHAHA